MSRNCFECRPPGRLAVSGLAVLEFRFSTSCFASKKDMFFFIFDCRYGTLFGPCWAFFRESSVVAGTVSTPRRGLTTGVFMTLLPTFGAHCISAACILAMTKSLALVAAQRIWNVQVDADVHVSYLDGLWWCWSSESQYECVGWFQLFVSFCQYVFDFNDSLWSKCRQYLSVIAIT